MRNPTLKGRNVGYWQSGLVMVLQGFLRPFRAEMFGHEPMATSCRRFVAKTPRMTCLKGKFELI